MLEIIKYKKIKQVKDSSPFTCHLTMNKYIDDVRTRLSRWYGIPKEKITVDDVYNFLLKGRI